MTIMRAHLHKLVDQIPEDRLEEAALTIEPLTYPQADEPLSDEDLVAIHDARIRHLKGQSIPHDEAMRMLGLD
jgi:hypothetical protein